MNPGPTSACRRRPPLASEEGFGIVEALVAAVILILASLAVFGAYDASTRATFHAQQSQVELSRAQQELEKIRALGYSRIALTSMPDSSTDPTSPIYRVKNGQFNLNRTGSANYARLVVNGGTSLGGRPIEGGTIDPGGDAPNNPNDGFTSGDVTYHVWRFVVWQKNNGCPQPNCNGQDIKRVIIVVKPDQGLVSGTRDYIEVHSDFIDPQSNSLSNIPANGGPAVTAQQFWLSDTPCDPDGETDRQAITADHNLHNTFLDCPAGLKNGTTAGAPDSLLTASPPGIITAPYFNYDSDSPTPAPPAGDPHKGIQIQPETQTSPPNPACTWQAAGSTAPQTRFHIWLSDPMPSSQPFDLTGRVTLSFFSRTVNGGQYPGKICIWLFRDTPGAGQAKYLGVGASTTAASWTYSSAPANWPTTYINDPNEPPTPLTTTATLTDNDLRINANSRLGLAISVAPDVTPSPGLGFMYDHPAFPAHLEIDTTTPLG